MYGKKKSSFYSVTLISRNDNVIPKGNKDRRADPISETNIAKWELCAVFLSNKSNANDIFQPRTMFMEISRSWIHQILETYFECHFDFPLDYNWSNSWYETILRQCMTFVLFAYQRPWLPCMNEQLDLFYQ